VVVEALQADDIDSIPAYGEAERNHRAELSKWCIIPLRPELHTCWVRRKNRWVSRRMMRLAANSKMRAQLVQTFESFQLRIKREAELHVQAQSAEGSMPSAYLSGALELRDVECRGVWSACAALAKALVYADRSELPKWAEPLAVPAIAIGLSRWMANSFNFGLPPLYARNAAGELTSAPGSLPARDSAKGQRYWLHFEWLEQEAKNRQRQAAR